MWIALAIHFSITPWLYFFFLFPSRVLTLCRLSPILDFYALPFFPNTGFCLYAAFPLHWVLFFLPSLPYIRFWVSAILSNIGFWLCSLSLILGFVFCRLSPLLGFVFLPFFPTAALGFDFLLFFPNTGFCLHAVFHLQWVLSLCRLSLTLSFVSILFYSLFCSLKQCIITKHLLAAATGLIWDECIELPVASTAILLRYLCLFLSLGCYQTNAFQKKKQNQVTSYATRPDTRQSSRGRLGRSSNAKTARNSKCDRPTSDTASSRVACPRLKMKLLLLLVWK